MKDYKQAGRTHAPHIVKQGLCPCSSCCGACLSRSSLNAIMSSLQRCRETRNRQLHCVHIAKQGEKTCSPAWLLDSWRQQPQDEKAVSAAGADNRQSGRAQVTPIVSKELVPIQPYELHA
jgi:hypothetical protein